MNLTPEQIAYNILRDRAAKYLLNSRTSPHYAEKIQRALKCTVDEAVALQKQQSIILAEQIMGKRKPDAQENYPRDLG